MGIFGKLEPCPEPDELGRLWRELEERADGSVFLSWPWVSAGLAAFGPPPLLFRALVEGRVAGLALLGRRSGRWFDWRVPSLHLHETGDPARDAVMVEYNGILAERGAEAAVQAALLQALDRGRGWREVHLPGVAPAWALACRNAGLGVRVLRHHLAPFAAFGDEDPLDTLSRNARQQIRRSLRLYQERGPLILDRAASCAAALDWFDRLGEMHTKAWQARGQPGAFANPWFAAFHRPLIEAGFGRGLVDLLRVRVGAETVGLLYNLRWRGWGHSYQSGFAPEADDRLKPGLTSHILAMRMYRAQGLAGYRFLAGDSRYKATLASGKDELVWLAAWRRDLPHRLEEAVRALRRS